MSDSNDIVQRLRAVYEKQGEPNAVTVRADLYLTAADIIEALEAEVKELREVWHKQVDVASSYFNECETLKAEVAALKHIAEHRHPTMDDLLNERLKTKAAEAQASRMREALEKIADSDNWPGNVARKALEQ